MRIAPRLQGHRQADARHPDAGRSRRAVPRDGRASTTTSRCCRCRRRRSRTSCAAADALDLARAANDGMAELVAAHPRRFPAFVASLPFDDPDAAVREAHPRDRRPRRARHPDVHERPRHADFSAASSCRSSRRWRPATCRSGCIRTAAPTCPTSRRRTDRNSRSGGRSAGRTRRARRWRAWSSPAISIGFRS